MEAALARLHVYADSAIARLLVYALLGLAVPAAFMAGVFSTNYIESLVLVLAWVAVIHAALFYNFVRSAKIGVALGINVILLGIWALFLGLYKTSTITITQPPLTFGLCHSLPNNSLVSCPLLNYIGTTAQGVSNLTVSQLDAGATPMISLIHTVMTGWPQVTNCELAFFQFACHALFPQCDSQCRRLPLCRSECLALKNLCDYELGQYGLTLNGEIAYVLPGAPFHNVFNLIAPQPVAVLTATLYTLFFDCQAPLPNATNYKFGVNKTLPLAADTECIGNFENIANANCSFPPGSPSVLQMNATNAHRGAFPLHFLLLPCHCSPLLQDCWPSVS